MKNLILLLLLTPMFCKAQSPDDHVVYPDTSLVIGSISIIGLVDTGTYVSAIPIDDSLFLTDHILWSYNSVQRSEDTLVIIDFEPIVLNVLKDYFNQNKPVMMNQTDINYTYNVLQILGLDLDARSIEMVISAHELILEKGGKASIDDIVKIKHELSKKYSIGKK